MYLSLSYLNDLREEEISRVLTLFEHLFKQRDILEIGSGTGTQLNAIAGLARQAIGLELSNGPYVHDRVNNIREYDGLHIPFPDAGFDVVFSSNVMEHIANQEQLNSEIKRVLRPGGRAIHVVPTRAWRILTSLLHYPTLLKTALLSSTQREALISERAMQQTGSRLGGSKLRSIMIPVKHGELGNWFSEYWRFGVSRWAVHFRTYGWVIDSIEPIGLAYTGNCLFADRLSMKTRAVMSNFFGSATVVFVLKRFVD